MAQRVGPVTLEDDDRDEDRTIVDVRALVSKLLPFAPLCSTSVPDLKTHQFRVKTMFVFVVFQRAAVPTRRHLCFSSAERNV